MKLMPSSKAQKVWLIARSKGMYSNDPKTPLSNVAPFLSKSTIERSRAFASANSSRIHFDSQALEITAITKSMSALSFALTLSSILRGSNYSPVTHSICTAPGKRFRRSTCMTVWASSNLKDMKHLSVRSMFLAVFSSADTLDSRLLGSFFGSSAYSQARLIAIRSRHWADSSLEA